MAVPLSADELRFLLTCSDTEFAKRVLEMPTDLAKRLINALDSQQCRCKPTCSPPQWIEDRDKQSPTFGLMMVPKDYRPCPYAVSTRDLGVAENRLIALLIRAYGHRGYFGPHEEPPIATTVVRRKARVAKLAERRRKGFKLFRDDEHKSKGLVVKDDHVGIRPDDHKRNEKLSGE